MPKDKRVLGVATVVLAIILFIGLTVLVARRQVRLVPRAQQEPAPSSEKKETIISPKIIEFFQTNPQGKIEVLVELPLPQKLEDTRNIPLSHLRKNSDKFISERKILANQSQQKLRRLFEESINIKGKEINKSDIEFINSFWIGNILHLKINRLGLDWLQKNQDIVQIVENGKAYIPEPTFGIINQPTSPTIEWNISKVNADRVWKELYISGQEIIVGSLDTGAVWTHPAIKNKYRGWNNTTGASDHNYNWFDTVNMQTTPYDDNSGYTHGTHTIGTVLGSEGSFNQIGVAPGAKWIAVKSFNSSGGGDYDKILSGMQWLIEPTRLDRSSPDASKKPHIVNNSWQAFFCNDIYRTAVQVWRAVGIVPVFANGNFGSSTSTTTSPGDYPESIAVGATDINDVIADFSSRGPSCAALGGEIKPEVSAPGVNIRSCFRADSYKKLNGTSMATPHVAGLVALLLSVDPDLSIDEIETIIKDSSIDLGTPGPDNSYGAGRIDAYQAVYPVYNRGKLEGTVTSSGNQLPSAKVEITSGQNTITLSTDENGRYATKLPHGIYQVTLSKFGYKEVSRVIMVVRQQTVTSDANLTLLPTYSVSGRVTKKNGSLSSARATITLVNTPLSTQTNPDGIYVFNDVPEGDYQIVASADNCRPSTRRLTVASNASLNFTLQELLLNENFETGLGLWVATSLWHIVGSGDNCFNPHAGNASAYFGLSDCCCYWDGSSRGPSGGLTSPVFRIPNNYEAEISFWQWFDPPARPGPGYDLRLIEVKEDAPNSSWVRLTQLPDGPTKTWTFSSFDLSSYQGKNIQLRFYFDSVASGANHNRGWYIDDIQVAQRLADLTIGQTAPVTISPNQNLIFQVHYENQGFATAENVVLQDNWQIQPGGEAGSLNRTLGNLAPGQSGIIEVPFSISQTASVNTIYQNTAVITTSTTELTQENNTAVATSRMVISPLPTPAVEIISPIDNTTVTGNIEFVATTPVIPDLKRVWLYDWNPISGKRIICRANKPPQIINNQYVWTGDHLWETSVLPNGLHTLTAKGFDYWLNTIIDNSNTVEVNLSN